MPSFLTMQAVELSDEQALERLYKVTFVVQHNPNCPHPFLVRLCGIMAGNIDMKPYGAISFHPLFGSVAPRDLTKDIIGSGTTLAEAARKAFNLYDQAELEDSFKRAVRAWERDSRYASGPNMNNHAYQRIIRMGEAAVPLILQMVKQRPSWLVQALPDITGVNPSPSKHQGCLARIIEDWLKWGEESGHISAGA